MPFYEGTRKHIQAASKRWAAQRPLKQTEVMVDNHSEETGSEHRKAFHWSKTDYYHVAITKRVDLVIHSTSGMQK